jgi:hypothetical protein
MKSLAPSLGLFLIFGALPACAQSPDAGSTPPPSPAKPADPAATAPAATDKKKPKKVWTNDEIGSVKGNVSVVGDGNSPSAKTGQSQTSGAANDARQQQIENYRNQIQGYKDQIDAIDKRIDQLKNFKAENTSPSGGINIHQGYNMVPLEDQVKQLEDKKKQLQAKIDDTEVEARKNGIDPGDLR